MEGCHIDAMPAYCFSSLVEPCLAKSLCFDQHYLLYCAKGSLRLEIGERDWVLLPSRAVWIPAGTSIRVDIERPIECCSLLFSPDFIDNPISRCQVLTLPSLLRDMILHARRWGPDRQAFDELSRHFFLSIANMCGDLVDQPNELWLPKGKSAKVIKVLALTQQYLAEEVTLSELAEQVGSSERSLSRSLHRETTMSWTQIQRQMRMIRAVELLNCSDDKILSISLAVGYQSLSSFNRAFKEYTSLTPGEFRTDMI